MVARVDASSVWAVADHQLVGARRCDSPNQDARPNDTLPELIVVHGISLPPGEFGGRHVEALFTNRLDTDIHPSFADLAGVHVSSHLLITRPGEVVQFVPFDRRAWHAGVSCWGERHGCNDFSIGIELEGTDDMPYTDAQYTVLAGVIEALRRAYPTLGPEALAGHCDVAPGRKTDPGPAFDWARVRRALG